MAPLLHSYTSPSKSWLLAWASETAMLWQQAAPPPEVAPSSLPGTLAKSSLSEQCSLHTQRDVCSHLFSVFLQVLFYFLLIFQSWKYYQQAQIPYDVGLDKKHKTVGALGLLMV